MKTNLEERNERIYREYHAIIASGSPKGESKRLFMGRYGFRSVNSINNAIKSHEQKISR